MQTAPKAARPLRILTNMAYWQSAVWTGRADSIYPAHGRDIRGEWPVFRQVRDLLQRRRDYDVVVTLGVRESMVYGLCCLLTGRAPRQIMTEVFIDEPRASLAWRLKTALYGVVARRAWGHLTNSATEIDTMSARYRVPRERFRFVPLNSTLAGKPFSTQGDGFILAAGRTLRDYPCLIEAVRGLPNRVIIICGRDDTFAAPLPPNVTVLREIGFEAYVDHIRRCTLLALPLRATGRATGQVVALDAMAVGKPVIVTRMPGTVDYIRHDENGLLVEPGDVEGLRAAIEALLADPARRERLGRAAYADVQRLHSFDTHALAKLQAIEDLYAEAHRSLP